MISDVNYFSDIAKYPYSQYQNTAIKIPSKSDSFSKEDKSKNGKFDTSIAVKNFAKGVISPLNAIKEHPVLTVGIIASTVLACTIIPVLSSALTIGFLGLSSVQLAKSTYHLMNDIKDKKYDNAEQTFKEIGENTTGTLLGLIGVKSGAQVAKEAKFASELGKNSLTDIEKNSVLNEINKNSFIKNIKEITDLITSETGRKSFISQFKPETIKTRISDLITCKNGGKLKKVEQKTRKELDVEFKNTPEGIRRAKLTNKEIEDEILNIYNKAFDELNIPVEHRPQIEVLHLKEGTIGGCYNSGTHKMTINSASYREGYVEIEDVVMHEATHTKEALLRAGIPQERAESIIKNELISRIMHGENNQVTVRSSFLGAKMTVPPKLPLAMKSDFVEFANEYLYIKYNNFEKQVNDYKSMKILLDDREKYCQPEILKSLPKIKFPESIVKLKAIMEKYPEYKNQFKDNNEAFERLLEYAQSHNNRFNCLTNLRVGMPKVNVKELSGNELIKAEKSLINSIDTIDGNNGISGLNGLFSNTKTYNQYQFCPEEVLAQQNGNSFAIQNLTKKLNEMKQNGTLTDNDEAYLTYAIEKANATIEYKTKGLEYQQKYIQLINNPNDKTLQAEVKQLETELVNLEAKKADIKQFEIVRKIISIYEKPDVLSSKIPNNAIYELLNQLKEYDKA